MTPKQKEIQLLLPMIQGKEVNVWLNNQISAKGNRKLSPYPFIEGTVDSFTGIYLILKNVLFWNGKFFADYMLNAGVIGIIETKKI